MPNLFRLHFVLVFAALSFCGSSFAQNQGRQQQAKPVPAPVQGIPISQFPYLNVKPTPPPAPPKSFWSMEGAYTALTSYFPNPFARPEVDPNLCTNCRANQDQNSATRQAARLQNLSRQVVPVAASGSQPVVQPLPQSYSAPPAPAAAPANDECGFFASWTACLYNAYSYVRGGYDRLSEIVMKHVTRPRAASSKHGGRTISGDRSKGMCKQAVNDFLVEAGLLCERIPGDHAIQANAYLRDQLHLRNMISDFGGDAARAPIGTILIYEGGGSGHIEFKLDPNKYCSDFSKTVPIDRYVIGRRLVGVYKPPGCNR